MEKMKEAVVNKLTVLSDEFEKSMLLLDSELNKDYDLKSEMKKMEFHFQRQITTAVDEEGKKLFSNPQQREIGIADLKRNNDTYIELADKHRSATINIQEIKSKIDIIKFKQRGTIAIVHLLSGE